MTFLDVPRMGFKGSGQARGRHHSAYQCFLGWRMCGTSSEGSSQYSKFPNICWTHSTALSGWFNAIQNLWHTILSTLMWKTLRLQIIFLGKPWFSTSFFVYPRVPVVFWSHLKGNQRRWVAIAKNAPASEKQLIRDPAAALAVTSWWNWHWDRDIIIYSGDISWYITNNIIKLFQICLFQHVSIIFVTMIPNAFFSGCWNHQPVVYLGWDLGTAICVAPLLTHKWGA